MAVETGSTYISGIVTLYDGNFNRKSVVFNHAELEETDPRRLRQRSTTDGQLEIARLAPKTSILTFSVVDRCRNRLGTVSSSSAWLKTTDLRLKFHRICHGSRDINTSGFNSHFRLSVITGIA